MAFPHILLLLQPDIYPTRSSFSRQVSAELKTSKAIFSAGEILYHTFISSCHHFIPNQIWCLQWSCFSLPESLSKWCFSSKTYMYPHQHRSQSSNFCLEDFQRSGVIEEHKKKDILQKSNILPQFSILCKMLVLQRCIFNCCYIN